MERTSRKVIGIIFGIFPPGAGMATQEGTYRHLPQDINCRLGMGGFGSEIFVWIERLGPGGFYLRNAVWEFSTPLLVFAGHFPAFRLPMYMVLSQFIRRVSGGGIFVLVLPLLALLMPSGRTEKDFLRWYSRHLPFGLFFLISSLVYVSAF